MLDRLIELINSSARIGFALAFTTTVILIAEHYEKLPFALSPDQRFYVSVGGLIGAGTLLFSFLSLVRRGLFALGARAYAALRIWLKNRNVMSRLGELTRQQEAALLWIAHNPKETIEGSPLEEPFRGLVEKGFLFKTSKDLFRQALRVNRKVYSSKDKIGKNFSPSIFNAILQSDGPWKWNDARMIRALQR